VRALVCYCGMEIGLRSMQAMELGREVSLLRAPRFQRSRRDDDPLPVLSPPEKAGLYLGSSSRCEAAFDKAGLWPAGLALQIHDRKRFMNNPAFLGIDVSKDKLDCALLPGSSVHRKTINNDAAGLAALDAWIHGAARPKPARLPGSHQPLRPGRFHSSAPVRTRRQRQPLPSIQAHGRSRLQRNKTDPADALLKRGLLPRKAAAPWAAQPNNANSRS
jgi:hypothetical protein